MEIEGEKILITGGAGFIGANFVYKFLELGAKVVVAEHAKANLWRLKKAEGKIETIFFDLTNAADVEEKINAVKPAIVIHFAAYGAYQRFQQDTALTIDTNLKGTINVVNACQKIGVQAFINTGSSSEYGIKNVPMKETDVLEPDNLYAITKSATTQYCQMMAKKHRSPIITVRPFAVYGPLEEQGRLIPDIIKACLADTELKLSNPSSVRDFIFIDDLIYGYLAAIENIENIKGEIFNLGSGKQHSIQEVVTVVKKIIGSSVEPVYGTIQKAQTEPVAWVADISKAKKLLHWQPQYNLEEGLKKDIEWFKANIAYYV